MYLNKLITIIRYTFNIHDITYKVMICTNKVMVLSYKAITYSNME